MIGLSYRIRDLIGEGGFGQVYRADFHGTGKDCALKTFHDKYLGNLAARKQFRIEAGIWVALERHPHIIPAYVVEEIQGRMFVAMEYIEPDPEHVSFDGKDRVSLLRFLWGKPLDPDRVIEWCLQFCSGMEHANAHGVRAHLDIKPQNILIGRDGKARITDFGLAQAMGQVAPRRPEGASASTQESSHAAEGHEMHPDAHGTPGYIAPEVYLQGCCAGDVRSDIYSFGLVMWQMASGSWNPPFHAADEQDHRKYLGRVYDLQINAPVRRIETPLWDIIERALRVNPSQRYAGFAELREDLTDLMRRQAGRSFVAPSRPPQDADFWNNRGISLQCLGQSEQAIACYDKAIEADARHAHAMTNKGVALRSLGRHEEALGCFDKAVGIDRGFAYAWHGRAGALTSQQRYEEALDSYRKALEANPGFYVAWGGQGQVWSIMDEYERALSCYEKVLEKDPANVEAMKGIALALERLGRHQEALSWFDRAVELNKGDPEIWNNKAGSLVNLRRMDEALVCCERALELESERPSALFLRAVCKDVLGRSQAAEAYRRYIARAAPDDPNLPIARQRLAFLEGS